MSLVVALCVVGIAVMCYGEDVLVGATLVALILASPELVIFGVEGELAAACPILEYPVEKDDTDTMLAIKVALEKGFQDLLLLGMTGGRLDHSIANIQSLVYAVIHGAKACLMDEDLWISAITGGQQITVPYREGFVLSVFAHSDRCSGVCLRDLFYTLENGVITNTFPLGVSNHFLPGKGGKIAIEEGIAVIICNREL